MPGGPVEERSLVPLGEARLGRIDFDAWLRRSYGQRSDPASAKRSIGPSSNAKPRAPKLDTTRFGERFRRMSEYHMAYCEVGFGSRATDVGFCKLPG
jgi:hypothetical protein